MENKKENKNGKMTLDKLAGMVARGFEKAATKTEMNSRFDSIERRLAKVEYQVGEAHDILKRFEENDILNIQRRVQILEKAVRALSKQVG